MSVRKGLRLHRQAQNEATAAARARLHLNLAAQVLGNLPYQGQAQPHTALALGMPG